MSISKRTAVRLEWFAVVVWWGLLIWVDGTAGITEDESGLWALAWVWMIQFRHRGCIGRGVDARSAGISARGAY